MSQKPVDQRHPLETRAAIWAEIRATRGRDGAPNRVFTLRDIWEETRASRDTVRECLVGWCRAGYLAKESLGSYRLIKDAIDPPRVRRDGTAITQGQGHKNMWRTMKILGEFTAKELAIHSRTATTDVAESAAADYCQHLHRAGYLVVILSASTRGGRARYRFLSSRYTGPKPPQVQRVKQIYDPNLGRVVWSSQMNPSAEASAKAEGGGQ